MKYELNKNSISSTQTQITRKVSGATRLTIQHTNLNSDSNQNSNKLSNEQLKESENNSNNINADEVYIENSSSPSSHHKRKSSAIWMGKIQLSPNIKHIPNTNSQIQLGKKSSIINSTLQEEEEKGEIEKENGSNDKSSVHSSDENLNLSSSSHCSPSSSSSSPSHSHYLSSGTLISHCEYRTKLLPLFENENKEAAGMPVEINENYDWDYDDNNHSHNSSFL